VILGIDHLVVAVRSVEEAAAALGRDLGLAFTGGGRHEALGTHNRLAFLGDTYVELIGVFDRGLVGSSGTPVGGAALACLDAGREGLVTFALATDDIAADVGRLRASGSSIGDPAAGSRTRPDGEVVRWLTAFAGLGVDRPPFLIEHEGQGAEWGPEARAARAAFRHPRGGRVRLVSLEIQVADRGAVAEGYGKTLGITFGSEWRATIGRCVVRLRPGSPAGAVGVDPDPAITLEGEVGTKPVDVVQLGVRWRRVPGPA
jgi:hypothetical protein